VPKRGTLGYYAAYAELLRLTCWNCGRVVDLTPDLIAEKANRGLDEALFDFTQRCVCQCGARSPKARAHWKHVQIGGYGRYEDEPKEGG
jgi:hypothetical protein